MMPKKYLKADDAKYVLNKLTCELYELMECAPNRLKKINIKYFDNTKSKIDELKKTFDIFIEKYWEKIK